MTPVSDAAQSILEAAVQEFAHETRFPIAFGGFEQGGITRVTALAGNRTLSLHDLKVDTGRGLGGRAMSEKRPRLTSDYARCGYITHHYDDAVAGENIVSLFAMPVVVAGTVRAILYGGTRDDSLPGTTFVQAWAFVTNSLAQEVQIEDEVSRRMEARTATNFKLPSNLLEELRAEHAELRRITATVEDPTLRAELLALEHRMAKMGSTATQTVSASESIRLQAHLTQRELDVLSHVSLGLTNAEIGRSLSITESTVKSYLNSVMSKFGASTRFAAVASARKIGLIP